MKKNKKLSDLFFNNKFVAAVSVIAAVIIWFVITVEKIPEVITDVPNVSVNFDESSIPLNLKSYTENNFKVTVRIKGPKYVVDQEDYRKLISVDANLAPVTEAGQYTLDLNASISGNRNLFSIESITPDKIDVYIDQEAKEEFKVVINNKSGGHLAADGYYAGDYVLDYPSVTAVGPKAEIGKIDRVEVVVDWKNLSSTQSDSSSAIIVTKDGSATPNVKINYGTINVKVPIYKKAVLPCAIEFEGKPTEHFEGFPYSVEPSSAVFGLLSDTNIKELDRFVLASISFSKLKPGKNKFTIPAEEIVNGIVLDGTKEFTVNVDVPDVETAEVSVGSIEYINLPDGVKVESIVPDFTKVIVVGKPDAIKNIKPEDLKLTVNLAEYDAEKGTSFSAPVEFAGTQYWIYGDYTATVTLAK